MSTLSGASKSASHLLTGAPSTSAPRSLANNFDWLASERYSLAEQRVGQQPPPGELEMPEHAGLRREGKRPSLGRPRKNTDEYQPLSDASSLHKPPAVQTQEDDEGVRFNERSPLTPGGSNKLHKASFANRLRAMSGPLSAPVSRAKVNPGSSSATWVNPESSSVTWMAPGEETALPSPPMLDRERAEASLGASLSGEI